MKRFLITALLCLPALAAFAQPAWGPVPTIVSGSAETSHVIKSSCDAVAGCRLFGFSVTTGAASGFVLLLDAASDPGNGAVTPKKCYVISANNTLAVSWPQSPLKLSTGIVLVFSTTGCFTETQSATAFFAAEAL